MPQQHNLASGLLASASLVAFDLDGTLVNAFDDIAAAGNHMLRSIGRPEVTTDEVKKHVGRGVSKLTCGLLKCNDTDAVYEKAFPILFDYYQKHPSDLASVYPGTVSLLEHLHSCGVLLAVTSNKPHPMTVATLESTDLLRYFDWVQGGDSRFPAKPHPAIFQYLIAEFAVQPDDCVVVGDTRYDVEFAKNAGAKSVAITHGQSTRGELEASSPDLIVDSFEELARLLCGTKD